MPVHEGTSYRRWDSDRGRGVFYRAFPSPTFIINLIGEIMEPVTLTHEERTKFTAWLRQSEGQSREALRGLQKVNAPLPLMKDERLRIAACNVLAGFFESQQRDETA